MKVLSEGLWLRRNTCTNRARYQGLLANLLIHVYFRVRQA